ncbi:MAG: hypothetical protein WAV04_03480 [Candidatus Microsaccharimonas sp.]
MPQLKQEPSPLQQFIIDCAIALVLWTFAICSVVEIGIRTDAPLAHAITYGIVSLAASVGAALLTSFVCYESFERFKATRTRK